MSYNGSHLICAKHQTTNEYCAAEGRWVCEECEFEEGRMIKGVAKIFKHIK